MIASAIMLVILVLTITAFLLVYVDVPIRKLVTAMDHVEQGNLIMPMRLSAVPTKWLCSPPSSTSWSNDCER